MYSELEVARSSRAIPTKYNGSVGEWFIPEVLKTSVLSGTVGSNPAASAKSNSVRKRYFKVFGFLFRLFRLFFRFNLGR